MSSNPDEAWQVLVEAAVESIRSSHTPTTPTPSVSQEVEDFIKAQKCDKIPYTWLYTTDVSGYCGGHFITKNSTYGHKCTLDRGLAYVHDGKLWMKKRFYYNMLVITTSPSLSAILRIMQTEQGWMGTLPPSSFKVYSIGNRHYIIPKPIEMEEQEQYIQELIDEEPEVWGDPWEKVLALDSPHTFGFTSSNGRNISGASVGLRRRFLPSISRGVRNLICSAWNRDAGNSDAIIGNLLGRQLRIDYPELLTGPRDTWVKVHDQDKYMCLPFTVYNKGPHKPSVALVFADEPLPITIEEYKVA